MRAWQANCEPGRLPSLGPNAQPLRGHHQSRCRIEQLESPRARVLPEGKKTTEEHGVRCWAHSGRKELTSIAKGIVSWLAVTVKGDGSTATVRARGGGGNGSLAWSLSLSSDSLSSLDHSR